MVIFGINCFALLIFAGAFVDTILRIGIDILAVSLSYYLSETLTKTKCYKRKENVNVSFEK